VLGLPTDGVVDPQDVVLSLGEDVAQAAEMMGCRVVQLRATPRSSGPQDASIYRYDQDSLMAALSGMKG
jgi:two-component system chemotaxis sensor kinase CheA